VLPEGTAKLLSSLIERLHEMTDRRIRRFLCLCRARPFGLAGTPLQSLSLFDPQTPARLVISNRPFELAAELRKLGLGFARSPESHIGLGDG
jgi:hypothetical protein